MEREREGHIWEKSYCTNARTEIAVLVHVLCFSTAPSYPEYPDFESRPSDPLDSITTFVGFFSLCDWIFKEVGWEGVDSIDLAQAGKSCGAVMKTVLNLRAP